MSKMKSDGATATGSHFDILGDVLETLRFRGSIFFRSQLAAPWGMELEPIDSPRFHIVLTGNCVIGLDEGELLHLEHMDIIVLPHGDMHWIADKPDRMLVSSQRAGEACELGNPLFQQGEITNKLICGIVHYEKSMPHPILDALPGIMHFSDIAPNDRIWLTVQLIDAEMENMSLSKTPVIDRLTEVLFLQLLYRYTDKHSDVTGFLSALADRRISRLLELIHRNPQLPWTIESLGQETGMSRATVARQFNKAVGMPPLAYLANWRMMKAHHLAKHSTLSFDEIAEHTGFSSARSLSKAFSRKYGYTPPQLRKKHK